MERKVGGNKNRVSIQCKLVTLQACRKLGAKLIMQLRGKWLCQGRCEVESKACRASCRGGLTCFFLTPSRSFWSKNLTVLISKIITTCQNTSLITLRSQWKKCLNYLHKRMIGCWRERNKPWERNTPGYITEQWATDIHCKHQSGMEKHLTHDSNPHPTLTATPMKRGQGLDFHQRARKTDGRMGEMTEGGRKGSVEKRKTVCKQGHICSKFHRSSSDRAVMQDGWGGGDESGNA